MAPRTTPTQPLLTDLYQLTMAYGYWKSGRADDEAVFNLFFRKAPFGSGYTVACGLLPALEYLESFRFQADDVAYLATLTGNDGERLFETRFLEYLAGLRLNVTVHGMPEGTIVFPHQPLLRVQGPIIQCQLLETALLNIVNFDTLVATKAARVSLAAQGDPVLEFGLRRAQGRDGALSASRAAYVGGCAATSNVLAGKCFGIPVRGTHAHSWVMSFDTELEAFRAYAEVMPNNCVFLVDTYDTLEGVRHAITVGKTLRERGKELVGIRLDSGDLAWLSVQARKLLDEAGFPKAIIVASNDLDEGLIQSLKMEGAAITSWGVGTRLSTAYDQPALGGVYKLSAVRRQGQPKGPGAGKWAYRVKLSEQAVKVSNPGIQQVRRFSSGAEFIGDAIYDEQIGVPEACTIVDPMDATRQKTIAPGTAWEDLLVPVFRGDRPVYAPPPLADARARTLAQLAKFHPGIKRLVNPHQYPVGLEQGLFELRTELVMSARRAVAAGRDAGATS
jgi:nicotinate phosphoribosyltransferase